jgi:hypothetical protein
MKRKHPFPLPIRRKDIARVVVRKHGRLPCDCWTYIEVAAEHSSQPKPVDVPMAASRENSPTAVPSPGNATACREALGTTGSGRKLDRFVRTILVFMPCTKLSKAARHAARPASGHPRRSQPFVPRYTDRARLSEGEKQCPSDASGTGMRG